MSKSGDEAALCAAVARGDEVSVRSLLAKGVDANATDRCVTALMMAAEKGHLRIVQALLDNGAKVNENVPYNRGHALTNACYHGDLEVVRTLLARGADVNAHHNTETPLMIAARTGNMAMMKVILAEGPDIDSASNIGLTGLMIASSKGHIDAVCSLLDNRAAIDRKDIYGRTALIIAAETGNSELVRLLIDRGADINAKGISGYTALMSASRNCHHDAVKALLAKGADSHARSRKGDTVLSLAKDGEIRTLLMSSIASGVSAVPEEQKSRSSESVVRRAGSNSSDPKHRTKNFLKWLFNICPRPIPATRKIEDPPPAPTERKPAVHRTEMASSKGPGMVSDRFADAMAAVDRVRSTVAASQERHGSADSAEAVSLALGLLALAASSGISFVEGLSSGVKRSVDDYFLAQTPDMLDVLGEGYRKIATHLGMSRSRFEEVLQLNRARVGKMDRAELQRLQHQAIGVADKYKGVV